MVLNQEIGKYHFVINPDITISSDVISDMVDYFESNPDVVMAMPKIMNQDGTEQKLPKERPTFKRLFFGRLSKKIRSEYVWASRDITAPTEIDFCTGCFFCIRGEVFKKLLGFDERYFMYFEDADITREVRRHKRAVYNPDTVVYHVWGRDSKTNYRLLLIHIMSMFKYFLKWKTI